MIQELIDNYIKTKNNIVETFLASYFDCAYPEYEWTTDNVVYFADYYLSFSDILYCLDKGVDKEDYFQYYDCCLEDSNYNLSLEKFLIEPEERKRQEMQYLKELEERVKTAEKEFYDYLNKTK